MAEGTLFTPIQTFQGTDHHLFEKDKTFVRAGHPILDTYGHMFHEVRADYEWPDEQATAAPGERRGAKTHV